jgi:hypothetical protein
MPWMNFLKKWPCHWWIIRRVRSSWHDRSSHRGTIPRHNFCTTHNSDLSSLWCDPLWCSQTASKTGIGFRRQGSTITFRMKVEGEQGSLPRSGDAIPVSWVWERAKILGFVSHWMSTSLFLSFSGWDFEWIPVNYSRDFHHWIEQKWQNRTDRIWNTVFFDSWDYLFRDFVLSRWIIQSGCLYSTRATRLLSQCLITLSLIDYPIYSFPLKLVNLMCWISHSLLLHLPESQLLLSIHLHEIRVC